LAWCKFLVVARTQITQARPGPAEVFDIRTGNLSRARCPTRCLTSDLDHSKIAPNPLAEVAKTPYTIPDSYIIDATLTPTLKTF
jgi:hypothetical protein